MKRIDSERTIAAIDAYLADTPDPEEIGREIRELHRNCPVCHPVKTDWLKAGSWAAALVFGLLVWGTGIWALSEMSR